MKLSSVSNSLLGLSILGLWPSLCAQVVDVEMELSELAGDPQWRAIGPLDSSEGSTYYLSADYQSINANASLSDVYYTLNFSHVWQGTNGRGFLVEDSYFPDSLGFNIHVHETSSDATLTMRNVSVGTSANAVFGQNILTTGGADAWLENVTFDIRTGLGVGTAPGYSSDTFESKGHIQLVNSTFTSNYLDNNSLLTFYTGAAGMTIDLIGGHTFADTFSLSGYDPSAFLDTYGFDPDASDLSIHLVTNGTGDGSIRVLEDGTILGGSDGLSPFTITATALVPEPGTYALLGGLGALGLILWRRRAA
ncbi:MAG: PEP-CTERM sorting domain-containing protein [Verrucomicrobiota bacterium JB022]|nr:PEP-CTERM sorting domain-containing protein [Verrucomicrobiota bacterium JB022]